MARPRHAVFRHALMRTSLLVPLAGAHVPVPGGVRAPLQPRSLSEKAGGHVHLCGFRAWHMDGFISLNANLSGVRAHLDGLHRPTSAADLLRPGRALGAGLCLT